MTIWGAEFDDEGYVDYIYYADNNYGDQDPVGLHVSARKYLTGKTPS